MSDSVSVKVTSLDQRVTEDDLERAFGSYGTITSLNLRDSSPANHCFINFETAAEAHRAMTNMNGKDMRGMRITCKLQGKSKGGSSSAPIGGARPVGVSTSGRGRAPISKPRSAARDLVPHTVPAPQKTAFRPAVGHHGSVELELLPCQQRFLRQKRPRQLVDIQRKFRVEIIFSDDWSIVGKGGKVAKAKDAVQGLVQSLPVQSMIVGQKQSFLEQHLLKHFNELRSVIEEVNDAVLIVPTFGLELDEDGVFHGYGRGGGGRSATEPGGRRGGAHTGAGRDQSKADYTITFMAGDDAILRNVVDRINEVDGNCAYASIKVTRDDGQKIIDAKKANRLRPYLQRANIKVSGGTVHINAMSRSEVNQTAAEVQAFISGLEAVQEEFDFDDHAIGHLTVLSHMPRIERMATQHGVHVNTVRQNRHSPSDRREKASLVISGERGNVRQFSDVLRMDAKEMARSTTVDQVRVNGLETVILTDYLSDIVSLEVNCGVVFSWDDSLNLQPATDKNSSLSRSTSGSAGAGASKTTGCWEWKDDDGWKPYPANVSASLDRLLSSRSKGKLQTHGKEYILDPMTGKQINQQTGFQRDIRQRPVSGRQTAQWQFQNDSGGFTNYSHDLNAELETANGQLSRFTIVHNRMQYTIDFTSMKQTNKTTGTVRRIQRVLSQSPGGRRETGALPSAFDPFKDGRLVNTGAVRIHGDRQAVQTAKTDLARVLNDRIVDQEMPLPCSMTAELGASLSDLCCRCVVTMEIAASSSSAVAASTPGKKSIVIKGTQKRVDEATRKLLPMLMGAVEVDAISYPPDWEEQDREVELKPMVALSPDYQRVVQQFRASMSNATIISVERVQNKFLWEKFLPVKKSIKKKIGHEPEEKFLFHGTRNNPPRVIYLDEEGFDLRFSSEGLWGKANYFATDASYSHNYSYCLNGQRQMFLAQVVTGDSYTCPHDQETRKFTMPPVNPGATSASLGDQVRYDTVSGRTNGTLVYMVYRNCQAYPAYLITYLTV
ncbi:uncharacterized protein LOC135818335 isoform X3 [Sycon ciliatum]|uniref:uncharacterized protein LOC135818335 isoform X3 n=1 Tax=Sycon ciliatum TaxID=27933 RepID=UPI0031F64DAE